MGILKTILAFASGAAIGSAAVYVWWLKKVNPTQEKELLDLQDYANKCRKYGDEMEAYAKSMYLDLKGGEIKDFEDAYKVYSKNKEAAKNARKEENGKNPISEQPGKSKVYNQQKTNKINYSQYYDAAFGNGEIEIDAAEKEHPTEDESDIYLISEEQFYNASHNTAIDLAYYDECGTLAKESYDAANEPAFIEDPVSILGDALQHFGEKCSDPDEVFVRNDNIGEVYHITRYRGTYKENVLGIYDD